MRYAQKNLNYYHLVRLLNWSLLSSLLFVKQINIRGPWAQADYIALVDCQIHMLDALYQVRT